MKDIRAMRTAWGLLFLRLSAALMLLAGHGWDKLQHLSDRALHFPDPFGLGSLTTISLVVFAEVGCTALVCLGLLTRLAALPILMSLATAIFVIHADDPWSRKEFALLYAIPFLTVLLMGPGAISIDSLRSSRRQRHSRRLFTVPSP